MADTTSRFAPPWDGPRLSLDLDALAHNWRTVVAASAGQRIGAVVKNDAYGLGVQASLRRCGRWVVASFGFARSMRLWRFTIAR